MSGVLTLAPERKHPARHSRTPGGNPNFVWWPILSPQGCSFHKTTVPQREPGNPTGNKDGRNRPPISFQRKTLQQTLQASIWSVSGPAPAWLTVIIAERRRPWGGWPGKRPAPPSHSCRRSRRCVRNDMTVEFGEKDTISSQLSARQGCWTTPHDAPRPEPQKSRCAETETWKALTRGSRARCCRATMQIWAFDTSCDSVPILCNINGPGLPPSLSVSGGNIGQSMILDLSSMLASPVWVDPRRVSVRKKSARGRPARMARASGHITVSSALHQQTAEAGGPRDVLSSRANGWGAVSQCSTSPVTGVRRLEHAGAGRSDRSLKPGLGRYRKDGHSTLSAESLRANLDTRDLV